MRSLLAAIMLAPIRRAAEAEAFAQELLVDSESILYNALAENIEMAHYYGIPARKVSWHRLGGFE